MFTNVVCFCFVLKIKWRLPPDWRERLSTNEFVFVFGRVYFCLGGMIALFYFYQADFRGPMPKTNCVFNNYLKICLILHTNKIHFFRQPLISNLRIFISPSLWISREKLLSNHRSCLKCIHAKHLKITKHALSNNHLRDATSQKLLSFLS